MNTKPPFALRSQWFADMNPQKNWETYLVPFFLFAFLNAVIFFFAALIAGFTAPWHGSAHEWLVWVGETAKMFNP